MIPTSKLANLKARKGAAGGQLNTSCRRPDLGQEMRIAAFFHCSWPRLARLFLCGLQGRMRGRNWVWCFNEYVHLLADEDWQFVTFDAVNNL